MTPFLIEPGCTLLKRAHFFALPWPAETLLALGEHQVRLRVSLSYFVEPNPSADAPLSPARYRSAGLRFDLRRRNEPQDRFEARVHALATIEQDDEDRSEEHTSELQSLMRHSYAHSCLQKK